MNKEFLENYDAQEHEEIVKILSEVRDGKIESRQRYPPSNRLKLNEPYTRNIKDESLWNQLLPHIGTVIIELWPIKEKKQFEQFHGFKVEDVGRLIDFAKETGKIQFCLGAPPSVFKEIDFVESIFLELQPPVIVQATPAFAFFPIDDRGGVDFSRVDEESKIWVDEIFHSSVHLQFDRDCIEILKGMYGYEKLEKVHYSSFLIFDYVSLRLLGYHELADEIIQKLIIDPVEALCLLSFAKNLILQPNSNILGGIDSWERNRFRSEMDHLTPFLSTQESCRVSHSMNFPIEIGKFLNNKLKLIIPENYNGVIEVNDLYDGKDLNKLTKSLEMAIENEDLSGIDKNADELFAFLNNTWDDVEKLKNYARFFRHGISFGIAVIGAVATMPIGGVGGLLAGLGFEVAEKIADIRAYEPVSEKIMKMTASSHMVHVYDFKKKYNLIG